jgi:uncharacterized protein YggT (Ycf19 family)
MSMLRFAEQFFWTMVWILVILVIFVFLSKWAQDNNVPFISSVFSWTQQHAGLEQ